MPSRILLALVTVTVAASAQFPFGHATPVNGFAPNLFGEPLWLGNPGYGYRIQGAPPGGSAIVGVSSARQDQLIGGLQVYLDLANVGITHSGTVDAGGRATIPYPLSFQDDPALTGLRLYAQAAVTDPANPGTLATTEPLLLEITAHPLVAFSAWRSVLWLLDPVTGATTLVGGIPPNVEIRQMVFANGGRDLFVASSTGILLVDTLAPAPSAVNLLTGYWTGIAWDREHRRVYAAGVPGIGVVDGNRASPGFGSALAQVTDANLYAIAASSDGSTLALRTYDSTVTRREANPSSPTYLQVLPMPAPALSGLQVFPGGLHVSPDGRIISVPWAPYWPVAVRELHRFDCVAGEWIDHDPGTPGYQPFASPQGASNMLPTPDGSGWVFASNNAVTRVDLDLASPASMTTATSAPISTGASGVWALTASGRFVLRSDGVSTFSFIQVSTGWVTPWLSIPPSTNYPTTPVAAWR